MLTEAQSRYLMTIPEEKIVEIKPFSRELEETGAEILAQIHSTVPDLEVRHMGASALGLSGQGDLDIYIFASPNQFESHVHSLEPVFGHPVKKSDSSIKWDFRRNNFPVEMYLTDPTSSAMQEQIKMYEILRDNEDLRKEYETLKEKLNGHSFREYQAAKYEFYNKLLTPVSAR